MLARALFRPFARYVAVFVLGAVMGLYFGVMMGAQDRIFSWKRYRRSNSNVTVLTVESIPGIPGDQNTIDNNGNNSVLRRAQTWDDYRENHSKDDRTVADTLFEKVRVFCWVMTSPMNRDKKAVHVKATWLKRCNGYVFISSEDDLSLPAVKLPGVKEGRRYLWGKTKAAFRYIYQQHLNDYDWFLKADDDTYVIMENLRHLLSFHNNSEPVHFGRQLRSPRERTKQPYMSGGAGYVLSREAVRRLAEHGLGASNKCESIESIPEDFNMGKCLGLIGVVDIDTRDEFQRDRFHPFRPEVHLFKGYLPKDFWFWKYIVHPSEIGPGCCSDFTISFHYIQPSNMYVIEFFIYHLRPFGISKHYSLPPNFESKRETTMGVNGEFRKTP
ncbi:glycoprotein-N-acetylgalactosamine 3-beta-galactosyltransferase 1-like [Tubulanus polymorphus]|uniref:glycoprotein-N-acetylgalactosamine 3-beta-galactosyltransferase 1-like n=1 Tax=Tubulanus polymorphus TaxID=672921 RepID=UPI003DA24EF2